MNRRTALKRIGAFLGVSTTAGCLSIADGRGEFDVDESTTEKPEMSNEQPPLSEDPRDVLIKNYHDEGHTLSVRVEFESETVLSEEYDLSSRDGDSNIKRIEDLADRAGEYAIEAELASGQTATFDWQVSDEAKNAIIYVEKDGDLLVHEAGNL